MEEIADSIKLDHELLNKKAHIYSEERVILTDDEFSSKDGNIKTREFLLIGFLYCKQETVDDVDDRLQNLWYLVNPGCSVNVPIPYIMQLLKDLFYISVKQRIKVLEEYEEDDKTNEDDLKDIEKENLNKFKYLRAL